MKILHIITNLGNGGAEALIKDYAINFDKKHNFQILVLDRLSEKTSNEIQLQNNNITIDYVSDHFVKKLNNYLNVFRYSKFIGKYLSKNKFDIIHVHLDTILHLYLCKKYLSNEKIFYTVHNDPYLTINTKKRKIIKWSIIQLIRQKNLQLIALHNCMKNQLNEMFKISNTLVVNNGIDLKRFNKNLYDTSTLRTKLGFSDKDFIIGHVGRFVEQKNHIFLISVFRETLRINPNSKLLLIGNGPLKKQVENLIIQYNIEDKVTILSNRTDIPELMSIMNVFVFPSNYEGFGIVLIEAQSLKIKCIVSNNVPASAKVSENFYSLGLEEAITLWVNTILTPINIKNDNSTIEDYNIINIVKNLEYIYSNK